MDARARSGYTARDCSLPSELPDPVEIGLWELFDAEGRVCVGADQLERIQRGKPGQFSVSLPSTFYGKQGVRTLEYLLFAFIKRRTQARVHRE